MVDGTETSFHWDITTVDESNNDEEIKGMNDCIKDARGQKSKSFDNSSIKDVLSLCQSYSAACLTLTFLDDTLSAVSNMHQGSRPISVYRLYNMLSSIDSITTLSVMQHTGLSKSHCRMLATILKVASVELTRRLKGYVVVYQDGNVTGVTKEQSIVDRKEYVQWFIEQQGRGLYEGLLVPK